MAAGRHRRQSRAAHTPVRMLEQPFREPTVITKCDAEMEPQCILWGEVECHHLFARAGELTRNIGSERRLADTALW